MTLRLYDTDSHLTDFSATVLSCTPCEGGYDIVLDQTAFFPGGGGQEADAGTLNGLPILSFTEKNQIVHHILASALRPGESVRGCVDFTRRFSNMQQHSGEHILSGLLHKTYGVDNVGFHMGSAEVTLDINGVLTMDELLTIERRANEAICQNLAVSVSYPDEETLSSLNYRSKKELTGAVRIVAIDEGRLDLCACCAPHVKRTGEIGLLKILSVEKYKGGTRIHMLAGSRALEAVNRYQSEAQQIGMLLSVKAENASSGVKKMITDAHTLHEQLLECQRRLIRLQAASVPPGTDTYVAFESFTDMDCAREYVNLLTERRDGPVALFLARGEGRYQYILSAKTVSVRALGQALNQALNGRGGGSDAMVQGSLSASRESIEAFFGA